MIASFAIMLPIMILSELTMSPLDNNFSSSNVLILGMGLPAARLYREIAGLESAAGFSLKGIVSLEEQDSAIPEDLRLQSEETLLDLATRKEIAEIVVVQDKPRQICPIQQLLNCKLAGIKLNSPDSFLERVRRRITQAA